MPTKVSIDAKGLDGSIRALDRWSDRADRTAGDELDRQAAKSARRARQGLRGRPGGGTYKRRPSDIGDVSVRRGGGIEIAGGFTTIGAEFGAHISTVFGRRLRRSQIARPHFAAWTRGDEYGGRVVGAELRQRRNEITRETADAVARDLTSALNRQRVPRRGGF